MLLMANVRTALLISEWQLRRRPEQWLSATCETHGALFCRFRSYFPLALNIVAKYCLYDFDQSQKLDVLRLVALLLILVSLDIRNLDDAPW